MELLLKEYQNKVKGCWYGKSIGGTLGAPLECYRGVFDVDFYLQDLSKGAPPNDDLDLQLLWLNAAERYGKNINARILGEYWLTYVTADLSEYGTARANMRMGLLPPLSALHHNHNKDSNGAFIRSEIWACLMPGHPEKAVKYAYEDAIVDHVDEGLYAEIFSTAVESAAFSESDMERLIEIGLSYIPEDCAVAAAVHTARRCYRDGLTWQETRKEILRAFPSAFGMYVGYKDQEPEEDVPVGELGFDAPATIGLLMTALLYGEGDFEKTICIAVNCGEDTDCTAATLGSVMGIIMGADALPEKWLKPLGEEIQVGFVSQAHGLNIPKTVSELTVRVVNLMPTFLGEDFSLSASPAPKLTLNENEALFDFSHMKGVLKTQSFREFLQYRAGGIHTETPLFDVTAVPVGGINIFEGEEKKFVLRFDNIMYVHQWVDVTLHVPENWSVSPCRQTSIFLDQAQGGCTLTEFSYTFVPNGLENGKYEILLEIRPNGRISSVHVPVVFIVGN